MESKVLEVSDNKNTQSQTIEQNDEKNFDFPTPPGLLLRLNHFVSPEQDSADGFSKLIDKPKDRISIDKHAKMIDTPDLENFENLEPFVNSRAVEADSQTVDASADTEKILYTDVWNVDNDDYDEMFDVSHVNSVDFSQTIFDDA